MIFYPKAKTPVCSTEIIEYCKVYEQFEKRETEIIYLSECTEFLHHQFCIEIGADLKICKFIEDQNFLSLYKLGGMNLQVFPAQPQRVSIFLDEFNVIRYCEIGSFYVGRNPKEHLRILDALQTGELCAACREEGGDTIKENDNEL